MCDEVILCAGGDVEVGTQLCVLCQPEFVVGFQPVDLAVTESEVSNSLVHFVVVCQTVYLIIFGETVLQLPG